MKLTSLFIVFTLLLFSFQCKKKSKEETHMKEITTHIISTKKAIIAKEQCNKNSCLFLAFWDFDGTILKGDCSEGYQNNNKNIYKGLVELAIKNNFSQLYSEKQYEKFWKKYKKLDEEKGHYASYTFLTQIFAGTKEENIQNLADKHIKSVIKNYFFESSIKIFNKLKKNDIQNYVISASPDFFVKPLYRYLKISKKQIYGIELEVKKGILTNNILKPVNYAKGKTQKIQKIIKQLQKKHPKKKIYILAGFGNSYTTDGEFLKYIVQHKLPSKKTISVMINGGKTPKKYKNLFLKVNQSSTVK